MTRPNEIAALNFGGPATYRIVVQGALGANWIDRLGGMEVTTSSQESRVAETILLGRIRDQPALRGILETLYALHLPILEVKKIDSDCGQDTAANGQKR